MIRRTLITLMLLASAPLLSGCVVWEIRDGIRASNAQLVEVESTLDTVNTSLDAVNQRLDKVESGLDPLDPINLSLSDMQERLALLRSIDGSLTHVDAHLASLRKTISAIDSAIPFFDMGGDAPTEEPAPAPAAVAAAGEEDAAPAPTSGDAAAANTAETAPATPAAPASPAKRDALLGAWVSAYPDRDRALIFLAGGRYTLERSTGAARERSTGTWERDGVTLTLTPDAPATPPPPAKGARNPPPPPPGPESWTVVSLTARSLTLDGPPGLLVLGKP